jgi:LDH2 family malate/lactate/ureidoglycolate dehydrogenase
VTAENLSRQISAILDVWGMPADLARTTVDVMLYSDLSGIDSHGVSMLAQYESYWKKGQLKFDARPALVKETPVMALVDAHAGLGHPAAVMGMELACTKARAGGVAIVSVVNSHHFGPAGYYAQLAPAHGLIGMVMSSTRTISVVPTRGRIPVLGTNPIAFAAPAKRNRPFVLDMATATVAGNKVKVYALNKKRLPAGWVLDEHGAAILDPALAMDYFFNRDVGGMTPLGGTAEMSSHKGYGLAMMAHILGGVLAGGAFSPIRKRTQPASAPDNIGHFLLAIDPAAFRPDGAFEDDLDAVIDELHATPPVDDALPVLVAGDPEALAREERKLNGIPMPESLADQIRDICSRYRIDFMLA